MGQIVLHTTAQSTEVDAQGFISNWTSLVTDLFAAAPEARGRIVLDLINEPDGYGFTW